MKQASELFFIAIIPPFEIQEEVTAFKKYAAEHFDSKHALRSPPHITLIPPFRWHTVQRPQLIQFLSTYSFVPSYFGVSLNHFDCFAPRVIFVDIEPEPTLNKLQTHLAEAIQDNLGISNKGPFDFHPHMTIAFRDLNPSVFPTAWDHFSTQSYQRSFRVDTLVLLHHAPQGWQITQSFPLAS